MPSANQIAEFLNQLFDEVLAKTFNDFQLWKLFMKSSIVDACQGPNLISIFMVNLMTENKCKSRFIVEPLGKRN